ncbi:MAG: hypothetical protein HYY37_01615 [Candidatus Aenigmarchaeota archaeon]|nr:hypothetical protein [Candidatus Aenigmarchaeota archaeon]
MEKKKIAISLNKDILKMVDAKVDGSRIRSRSQSIEVLVRRGLDSQTADTAVILLSKAHQKIAFEQFKTSFLLKQQADFFRGNMVSTIIILAQDGGDENIESELAKTGIEAQVRRTDKRFNGEALFSIRDSFCRDFIVMSGDIYNQFNLRSMVEKHMHKDKLATMGLITHRRPTKYGSVTLDGDFITDFQEKPKAASSHLINAGIYLFKPEIFDVMHGVKSLEKDLFPKLSRMRQLIGYVTSGEYAHLGG